MCDQHALFLHACLQRHSAQTRLRHMFPQGHLVLYHIVLCCSSMTVFSMCIASVLKAWHSHYVMWGMTGWFCLYSLAGEHRLAWDIMHPS